MTSTEPTTLPSKQTDDRVLPTTEAQLQLAVASAEERKAEEIRVLEVGRVCDFTEFFVICSGTNERQVQAISDTMLDRLRDVGIRPLHVEGYDKGKWVLLDFGGDMVIHVFQPETRAFYALERLWADTPEIAARFVTAATAQATPPE